MVETRSEIGSAIDVNGRHSSIEGFVWRRDEEVCGKANLFASTFSSKFVLPPIHINEFSPLDGRHATSPLGEVTTQLAEEVISKLKVDSATGPTCCLVGY